MTNFAEMHAETDLCHLCDFMVNLMGKPQLCSKLEIGSFSYCITQGEPQIFWSSPYDDHTHFCLLL